MELLETDMGKLLKNSSEVQMNEQQVLVIIYNILCALNFFHSANVIHRDLKPANILI